MPPDLSKENYTYSRSTYNYLDIINVYLNWLRKNSKYTTFMFIPSAM